MLISGGKAKSNYIGITENQYLWTLEVDARVISLFRIKKKKIPDSVYRKGPETIINPVAKNIPSG